MLKINLIVMLVLCGICDICSGSLPPEVNRCKVSDNVCIAKAINDVIRLYPKGNPAFGLIDLSQIKQEKLIISENTKEQSSLNIHLILKNVIVSGVENTKVIAVSGFDPNISKIVVNLEMLNLKLNGDYEVDGSILLLQLKGQSKAELKIMRSTCKLMADVKLEEINGKNYLVVKRVKVDFQPQDFHIRLDNLFDGNEELTDIVNETINKNWRDFWAELHNNINQAFAEIVRNVTAKVFEKLSYNDFYIN
uniref:Uncharacterized protein n=1 Tax=Glossina brevipalpis TaxID=37001 RepID=A0A1A9WGW1_9MUSC